MLERALDPKERHRLGAHYTPRAYVERLAVPPSKSRSAPSGTTSAEVLRLAPPSLPTVIRSGRWVGRQGSPPDRVVHQQGTLGAHPPPTRLKRGPLAGVKRRRWGAGILPGAMTRENIQTPVARYAGLPVPSPGLDCSTRLRASLDTDLVKRPLTRRSPRSWRCPALPRCRRWRGRSVVCGGGARRGG